MKEKLLKGQLWLLFGFTALNFLYFYDQAVDVVLKHKAASASMLQRRLRIGYNRAANLIELMEERGIVGPSQGSKPREILSHGPV